MNIPEKHFLIPTMKFLRRTIILPIILMVSCAPTTPTSSSTPQSEPVQQVERATLLTIVNSTKKTISLTCDQGSGETVKTNQMGICSYRLSSEKNITTVIVDNIEVGTIKVVDGSVQITQNGTKYQIRQMAGSQRLEVTSK